MGSGGSKKKDVLLATYTDHEEAINCMALSEDSSLLVTGSDDKTARMWSTWDDMECLGVFRGHTKSISCVVICDTFVLTGSFDATIRKWDTTNCECLFIYEGHTQKISRLICTDDFIFSSSTDKTMKAWLFDVSEIEHYNKSKACIRTFEGHDKGVSPIIFIPGNDFPASDKGTTIHPGDILLTGSHDKTARSWSFDTGSCLKIYKGHTDSITCMVTDPYGQILYTGSNDSSIRSWNITTGKNLKVMDGSKSGVMCMTVANRLLYSGCRDGTAHCWVREMGDRTRTYTGHKPGESIVCIRFFDGLLFTACNDMTAAAFDSKSGTRLRQYKGHTGGISCLTVVHGRLITGSSDDTLRVWDITEFFEKGDSSDNSSDSDSDDSDDEEKRGRKERCLQELDKCLDSYIDDDPDTTSSPAEKTKNCDLSSIEEQLK